MLILVVRFMNVLLLSDFSEVAVNATHYAMDLLQDEEVKFTLLNIHHPYPDVPEEEKEKKRKAIIAKMEERVQKLCGRSSTRMHSFIGHYSEESLVKATRVFMEVNHVDLLVMGAVGNEFRHSTILGDHTYEIMTKIKCNILAIPEDVHFDALDSILMPLDYGIALHSQNLQFLGNNRLFQKAKLNVWEMATETNESKLIREYISQHFHRSDLIFSQLRDIENFKELTWIEFQKKFNLIVIHGKNLKICDQLMHNKHGLFTSQPNRIPILVLHD